ncbi:MAG TPA: HPr(Ser) kinase/phosphatase [Acidobacteriota bacterium]|nr:HPr(Ser) kinase/phosphatase [Acidobacteriota bacterium]
MLENEEVVSDGQKPGVGSLSVRDLLADASLGLEVEVLTGQEGLDNEIRSTRVQKLGMVLAGYSGDIHPDRIQILGGSESYYLQTLSPLEHNEAIQRLRNHNICCILVTKGLNVSGELLRVCREAKIPLLRSNALSTVSIARVTACLEKRLAPRMTIHGVLIEIFGLGVLLMGPSGIGKSECALELVLKGHRLITDDYVEITRRGIDRLLGAGGAVLRHHMELRGLGIINVKELFGISATSVSKVIDFAVRLERWNPEADYDRLGLDQDSIEFLGVSVPLIAMPVAPGRNVATLVEVAARIHLLRQRGYRPSIQE